MTALHDRPGRRSQRLQCTLRAVGIFVGIQLSLLAVILFTQLQRVRHLVDDQIRVRMDTAIDRLTATENRWTTELVAIIASQQTHPLYVSDVQLAVFDAGGNLSVASSADIPDGIMQPLANLAARATDTVELNSTTTMYQDTSVSVRQRLASKSFATANGSQFTLCLATPDTYVIAAMRSLLSVLAWTVPASLIAVFAAGCFVTGYDLRPLTELRGLARRLRPGTLGDTSELESSSMEVHRLEQELNRAMQRLDAGYTQQAHFLANVSHELRTPISVILAESQTIGLRHELPAEVRHFVESVTEEMQSLGRLIESFLLLSRVRDRRSRLNRQHCDVNHLVMDSVSDCAPFARLHSVRVHPTLIHDDDRSHVVIGDFELLRTAIDNILRNAIRFSPVTEPVHVLARRHNSSFEIVVRDHGPSIPPHVVGRMLEQFDQSPKERRRDRGTGLGLEIAHGVITVHDGALLVSDVNGEGCEFTIRIPSMPQHGDAESHEQSNSDRLAASRLDD